MIPFPFQVLPSHSSAPSGALSSLSDVSSSRALPSPSGASPGPNAGMSAMGDVMGNGHVDGKRGTGFWVSCRKVDMICASIP